MMTLEKAIKHCKDVALSCTNKECALEHFQLLKWLQEYSNMLKKQGEQKSTDKVEPKFKVGDWAVSDLDKMTRYIFEVHNDKYNNYYVIKGDVEMEYDINEYDRLHHLWTIQDAKDGDVLVVNDNTQYQWIGIFKEHTGCTFTSYCHYNAGIDEFITNKARCRNHGTGKYSNIHPATKEQRDLLFQKMKEAGYEWDAEKKKLRKIVVPIFNIGDTIIKKHNSNIRDFGFFTITDITGGKYWYNDRTICDITEQDEWELHETIKQNPAWSEEDERMYRRLHNLIYSTPYFDSRKESSDWLESIKDRVQPQPKQEWSEEDDQYLLVCKNALAKYQTTDKWDASVIYRWLVNKVKSLSPQNTWKPNGEQIEILDMVLTNESMDDNIARILRELREQLKKLRKE